MTPKLFGRIVAGLALTTGLVVLASQVSGSNHTAAIPAANDTPAVNGTKTDADGEFAVDLNNWQEARLRSGSGSKFKP